MDEEPGRDIEGGRPERRGPRRRHDKALQIRMTTELLDLIQLASERAGLSTSGWVRDRLGRLARRELRETGDETPRRSYRAPGDNGPV